MKESESMQIIKEVFSRKEDFLKRLDKKYIADVTNSIFKLITETIDKNGTVVTTGSGTSGILAEKISFDFSCIKTPSFYLSANSAVHGGLGALRSSDLLIIISRGAKTKETIDLLPIIRDMKLKYVLVTENTKSDLAAHADIVVKIDITEDIESYGILSIIFFNIVLLFFEAICLLIMKNKEYKFEDFTNTHPGGAFGERAREHNLKKSDL